MKLNLLIVEDSFDYALELQMLCEKIGYHVIGIVDNSSEALEIILDKRPDLILMDVNINGKLSGVEIGKNLKHLNIPIIYLTAFGSEDVQEQAKQSNVIAFLDKPINQRNLTGVLKMAVMETYFYGKDTETAIGSSDPKNPLNFYFRKNNLYHKVPIQEVAYATSLDNYCKIYLNNGENYLLRYSLEKLEEVLPDKLFVRCHRRYVIHRHKITTIDFKSCLLWINDNEIPFSRSKKEELQRDYIFLK